MPTDDAKRHEADTAAGKQEALPSRKRRLSEGIVYATISCLLFWLYLAYMGEFHVGGLQIAIGSVLSPFIAGISFAIREIILPLG